ncbi:MAG: class I SAM-dependent methyltransferase [Bacteroidia bacterium]
MNIEELFAVPVSRTNNLIEVVDASAHTNQQQTNDAFSEKWHKLEGRQGIEEAYAFQQEWYLKLYGFETEERLAEFLRSKKTILDAGCGLGYKAAWFARLAPESIVIGMDFSESVYQASVDYADLKNLFFVRGDIADTKLNAGSIAYVSCDQVIMHTEVPEKTFAHLSSLLPSGGEFACYVYAKKALPRELLDDYFRQSVHGLTHEQIWEMSEQLTDLGKRLSELNVKFTSPDIPLLGIKGGEYDIQRFIYWNFIKCFWNPRFTDEVNNATNFDWYSPSNAKRFSEAEFQQMISENTLQTTFFHREEACYSGRFAR